MRIEEAYRVVLFGHRDFNGHRLLEERLCSLLKNILCTHSFLEIYIGRNGEFDRYVASVVKHLKAVVGYVERDSGGAYAALRYAEKHGKNIINLA